MHRVLFIRDGDTGELKRITPEREQTMNQVLSAIIILASPLSCEGLSNLLILEKLAVERLVKKLGAVIYVARDQTVRVLHTTFHDYLLQSATLPDINFGVDVQATHRMLSEKCFALLRRTLKQNICAFKDPDMRAKDVKREELEQCQWDKI